MRLKATIAELEEKSTAPENPEKEIKEKKAQGRRIGGDEEPGQSDPVGGRAVLLVAPMVLA
ncbi:hypothetical protein BGZ93_001628, partial [Podila epicladia]